MSRAEAIRSGLPKSIRLIEVGDGYVLLRDGIARGYAISRLFGRGHVIGAVVAESPTDARALIEAALAPLGSVFVRVDTSATAQLGEWLEDIGLQQVSDATTMVLGTQMPSTGPARTFARARRWVCGLGALFRMTLAIPRASIEPLRIALC